jgi:hypothetical protein
MTVREAFYVICVVVIYVGRYLEGHRDGRRGRR